MCLLFQVTVRKDWQKTLPPEDHALLSKALYGDHGKLKRNLQMWYYPPQTAPKYSQPPSPKVFFHHRFFLWMPCRMFGYPLVCSRRGCVQEPLTSVCLYKVVRRVIDRVEDYYMGTEYLQCARCGKRVPAWSLDILSQLNDTQRSYFPAVLSYHLALDKWVLLEMRDWSLGNSSSKLSKKLQESHSEDYIQRRRKYVQLACQ